MLFVPYCNCVFCAPREICWQKDRKLYYTHSVAIRQSGSIPVDYRFSFAMQEIFYQQQIKDVNVLRERIEV